MSDLRRSQRLWAMASDSARTWLSRAAGKSPAWFLKASSWAPETASNRSWSCASRRSTILSSRSLRSVAASSSRSCMRSRASLRDRSQPVWICLDAAPPNSSDSFFSRLITASRSSEYTF